MEEMLKNPNGYQELKTLDNLILTKLNPNHIGFSPAPQELITYEASAKALGETIQNSIFNRVCELTEAKHIFYFIRNYQRQLVYLSNCIALYRHKFTTTGQHELYENYNRLLEQLSDLLADVLDFLGSHFPEYFDQDKEVPYAVKERAKKRFASKLTEITRLDNDKNHKLLKAVLLPAFEFQNDEPEYVATFRKINYLEVLLGEVAKVLTTANDAKESLKMKLIYLNFNSFLFFHYMIGEIKERVRKEEDGCTKICLLHWYMKRINQVGEKPGFALIHTGKAINEWLSQWLHEEINFVEKHWRQEKQGKPMLVKQPPNKKIKIHLSVSQAAYLMALFMDTGLFAKGEKANMVRFFASGFQTLQSETISEKSLSNKSTNRETGARTAVKDLLIKMINRINEGF
jgi:hypothetical protein